VGARKVFKHYQSLREKMRKPKNPFSGTGSAMILIKARNECLILNCLISSPKPAKQVAREVGITYSTAYKLLNELVEDGLVERPQAEKRGTSKFYKLKEI
jgi:DNA-binding MarR family transcriptional regulator